MNTKDESGDEDGKMAIEIDDDRETKMEMEIETAR